MTIEIKLLAIKRFGGYQYYPACQISESLCSIARKRSLSRQDIDILSTIECFDVKIEIVEIKKGKKHIK